MEIEVDKMNWKERPELFANGRFEFRHNGDGVQNEYIITHYSPSKNQFVLRLEGYGSETKICDAPKNLSLIARPISDLSDEEKEMFLHRGAHHNDDILFESIDTNYMTAAAFLYLLSIGVYPFDNNNPKDVIWRYENG